MLNGARSSTLLFCELLHLCALGALASPAVVACAPAGSPARVLAVTPGVRDGSADGASACDVSREPELKAQPQSIAPEQRVPDFRVATEACEVFDSRELVGKQPFVVVFFASWCAVCEHRMPLLRDALRARSGDVVPVWVSLDDAAEGWTQTDAFLDRHALARRSAVPGRDFLGFSLGYNPFRSVPVVVVVGRSGRVVTVQIGVREGDEHVLEQALDAAITEPPEHGLSAAAPLTSVLPR